MKSAEGVASHVEVRSEELVALDLRYRSLRLAATPAKRAGLKRSLEKDGQLRPVLASRGATDRLVLLDGFKRVELLEALEVEQVLVVTRELTAPQALAELLAANASRRGLSDLEQAWVIEELEREHGLTQVEIGALVGRHKSWVCRRLKLVAQLERQVQEDVKVGLIPTTVARELARLPRGNQAPTSQAIARHALTSRQARVLVGVLLATDPSVRGAVLQDPLRHLPEGPVEAKPPSDPRLGELANRLRVELLRLRRAARRLDDLLMDREPKRLSATDLELLSELAEPIAEGLLGLLTQLEDRLWGRSRAA